MNKRPNLTLFILVFGLLALFVGLFAHSHTLAILDPKGIVALKERNLIYIATALMLIVVIPVFVMTFYIAWRYRAENTEATYMPEWDNNVFAEIVWWGLPCAIILILSVITWNSSHQLDPFRKLDSSVKPMTVQVVALQWRWLFIYPEQHIASVNLLQFPAGTPINFQITSDAPMNSFWIPQLGGQIYAMAGMNTQLSLMADTPGTYTGTSANLSGAGFANMNFTVKSLSQADFDRWVAQVQSLPSPLTSDTYAKLAQPSLDRTVITYGSSDQNLYNDIMMKFMEPQATAQPLLPEEAMGGMDMSSMHMQ